MLDRSELPSFAGGSFPERITQAQADRLWARAKAHGWSAWLVLRYLESLGYLLTTEVRTVDYEAIMKSLRTGPRT